MKQLFYIIILICLKSISLGQSSFDLNEIERLTKDSTSAYFYSKLASSFINCPLLMDTVKVKFLYYGRLYTKSYRMFELNPDILEFDGLINKEKYKKAIRIGETILKENPANFEILSKMLTSYKEEELTKNADTTLFKLNLLMSAISHSGTGKDKENAFKVVTIGDEYAIMAWLGVEGISRQSSMKGSSTIDSWYVRNLETRKKYEMHFEWLVNAKKDN